MAQTESKSISFNTAIAIVVANMVGAGVFTSLGFQIAGDIESTMPLLMLWVVGGIVALCGALSYGELASLMPRSGGEYHYLTKIYHPAFGFLSGWASATVGFSAPVALACTALGRYTSSVFPTGDPNTFATVIAIVVLIIITAIHANSVKGGGIFQRYSTLIKVLLILIFIISGLLLTPNPQNISILPKAGDWTLVFSASFATSLAFVSFAYSGWNAAAYLAGEIENPQKNVPRALLLGTLCVMGFYVMLNYVFLYTVPVAKLAGQLEIGYISADAIFGSVGGKIMGLMIALLLVSSISSMIFAGPRVTKTMGEDLPFLKNLAITNAKGVPTYAVLIQSSISLILILTASFDTILNFIAFTLDIFTFSTVLGVFVMRFKAPNAERKYKAWGYPITPLIFLLATGWTMYFLLTLRTQGSLIALGVVSLGLVVYFIDKAVNKGK